MSGPRTEVVGLGMMSALWVIGEVADVDVRELEVAPTTTDLFLTPPDRGLMYIYSNIAAVVVEIVSEINSHLATTTANVQNTLLRL